jgi:hypothetical protein
VSSTSILGIPDTSLAENIVPSIESEMLNNCPLCPEKLIVAVVPVLYTLNVIVPLLTASAPVKEIVGYADADPVLGVITIFLCEFAIEFPLNL